MSESDTFVCESCGQRRMDSDYCEHDWNIHVWCSDCCIDNGYEEDPDNKRTIWEDLD